MLTQTPKNVNFHRCNWLKITLYKVLQQLKTREGRKMKYFFTILTLVTLLFPEFGNCSIFVSNSKSLQRREYEKRQPLAEKYLESAKYVCDETIDLKTGEISLGAKHIADFLELSMVMIPENYQGKFSAYIIKSRVVNPAFLIFPLFEDDSEILKGAWGEVYKQTRGAKLLHAHDTIIIAVSDVPMSPLWQGLSIIREVAAAIKISEQASQASVKDEEAHLQEQSALGVFAYDLVTDILKGLKGKNYQSLLDSEAKRMRSQTLLSPEYSESAKSQMDLQFGNSFSKVEEEIRKTTLWIGANFQLIERRYQNPEEIQRRKIKFISEALKNKHL